MELCQPREAALSVNILPTWAPGTHFPPGSNHLDYLSVVGEGVLFQFPINFAMLFGLFSFKSSEFLVHSLVAAQPRYMSRSLQCRLTWRICICSKKIFNSASSSSLNMPSNSPRAEDLSAQTPQFPEDCPQSTWKDRRLLLAA